MIVTIGFEMYMTDAGVFHVVVGKFSYWKKFSLVILLAIDESAELGFNSDVLPLGLSISLRMKDC